MIVRTYRSTVPRRCERDVSMRLQWGQLRVVAKFTPIRTTPGVWPNRERPRIPSPEPPQCILGSERDNRRQQGLRQYRKLCIPVCPLSHTGGGLHVLGVRRTKLRMYDKGCRLHRSTQHFLEVYSQEFEILKSFWDVDSSAARPGRAALANSQTSRCLAGSIAVTADWCFRSYRAARDSADRRSRPAHP